MPKLRIGSLPSGNSNHISGLRPTSRARVAKTIMERDFPRFERIRRIYSCDRSTLVSLKRGFGEYYQCGYSAALENRGSRLRATARGASALRPDGLRAPPD